MRKTILSIILAAAALTAGAQTVTEEPTASGYDTEAASRPLFGYLSYSAALRELPEYAEAESATAQLRASFQKEMERSRDEFNLKYEAFLDEQSTLVPSIRRKRQVELEDLLNANRAFREEARRQLAQSEAEAMRPARQKLDELIARAARKMGLAFVVNTDSDACPYIDPALGIDLNGLTNSQSR